MSTTDLRVLKTVLGYAQANYETQRESFLKSLTADPGSAFEWAEGIMEAAARAEVYNYWLEMITEDEQSAEPKSPEYIYTFIRDALERRVVEQAQSNRSAGALPDLIARYKLRATAELLAMFRRSTFTA